MWTIPQESSESLSTNGACPDFERLFRWQLARFVIERLAREIQASTGSVLVDTSTGVQHLQLSAQDHEACRLLLTSGWQQAIVSDD